MYCKSVQCYFSCTTKKVYNLYKGSENISGGDNRSDTPTLHRETKSCGEEVGGPTPQDRSAKELQDAGALDSPCKSQLVYFQAEQN